MFACGPLHPPSVPSLRYQLKPRTLNLEPFVFPCLYLGPATSLAQHTSAYLIELAAWSLSVREKITIDGEKHCHQTQHANMWLRPSAAIYPSEDARKKKKARQTRFVPAFQTQMGQADTVCVGKGRRFCC